MIILLEKQTVHQGQISMEGAGSVLTARTLRNDLLSFVLTENL